MAIEFHCTGCGQKLRLAEAHATGSTKCPACGAVMPLPSRQTTSSAAQPQWRVKTADGRDYGPVDRAELDGWMSAGRLDAGSQLLREGDARWRWAHELYPTLAVAAAPYAATPHAPNHTTPENPYRSPSAAPGRVSVPPGRHLQPHRGTLILVLGILGLMLCALLSVAAWIMGSNDIAAMDRGVMDPSGRSLTQAGRVCGIIGTCLMAIPLVVFSIMMLAAMLG